MMLNVSKIVFQLSRRRIALAVLTLAVFLIYSHTMRGPFVLDDMRMIEDNESIRNLGNYLSFEQLLKRRALVNLTFAINNRFGGTNVFGYHLFNIAIHLLSGVIVYFLTISLYQALVLMGKPLPTFWKKKHRDKKVENDVGPILALFTALLFVTHPIQTQAVTYIVQRYASMAALFYLASVLFYVKARISQVGKPGTCTVFYYILAIISGALAVMSKENAASLPGVIVLVEWLCFERSWRAWKKKLPWLAGPFVLWFLFILLICGVFDSGTEPGTLLEDFSSLTQETKVISRWEYLCTQFTVIVKYIRLLLFPAGQNIDHHIDFKKGFWDGATPVYFLLLAELAAWGAVHFRKNPVITAGVFWFFITLSVESSFIPIRDAMFEHRLYLPMFGFALLLPYLFFRYLPGQTRKLPVILLFLTVTALSTTTYIRNETYKDTLTLWTDVVQKSPLNARGHYNIGQVYLNQGNYEEALRWYKKALKLKPEYAQAYNNMGIALAALGRLEEAINSYHHAVRYKPDHAQAYYNMSLSHRERGNTGDEIAALLETIRIDPGYPDAFNNLGAAYMAAGEKSSALEAYRKGLETQPGKAGLLINLGSAYSSLGNNVEAISWLNKALEVDPGNPRAYYNLGNIYSDEEKMEQAIESYRQSIGLDPGFIDTYYNCGNAYFKLGNMPEAIALYEKALEIAPGHASAHKNLAIAHFNEKNFERAIEHCDRAIELGTPIQPALIEALKPYR